MATKSNELIRQSTLFASHELGNEDQGEDIDFKMVTFSLAGKEYGVDIMKVKEIAKFEDFTYVPNTQPFVSGVYNLRGDIISVIDLRIMLNLPATRHANGETEDGLILRLDSGLIGVVVDSIDRVVGISSESIQPPHPIFADINLKYISGVVEHDGQLFIILDVERILGDDSSVAPPAPSHQGPEASENRERADSQLSAGRFTGGASAESVEMVSQTLATLAGFTLSAVNRGWVTARLAEWQAEKGTEQITTQEEVDEFLAPFFSPYSGRFWDADYVDGVNAVLPELGAIINVWNPGCGRGFESYSIASLLRLREPNARIKVWAGDNDLLSVSTAPNLVFDRGAVPDIFAQFLVEGSNGFSFGDQIKQLILFEYSDITHASSVPPCDIVVIRDVLSFLREAEQRKIITMIQERTKESTLVICGTNEDLSFDPAFEDASHGTVRAFRIR